SNWIEENTDRSWRNWVRQYVIEPAELNRVAAGWRDPSGATALTHLAPPFRHDPEQSGRPVPSALPNPELNASSGIIASARDLVDYSIALDEGRILSDALREQLWTPPTDATGTPAPYAYGWYVQQWQDHRLVWHGGWWPDAYAGLLLKAPDDGWTLVALGNTDGLRHDVGNLTRATIEESPLAQKFIEVFISID
ncbi:MAG: serine hydrolase domain-containing protein, partial [Pseudomonadota bacterium]